MEDDLEFCARRAAEEFRAAGRAANPHQRMAHRQLAQKYAEIVRCQMDRHDAAPPEPPADGQSQSGGTKILAA